MAKYQDQLHTLLSPAERATFKRLNTPIKVQNFLDAYPVKYFGKKGEPIIKSPRQALKARGMHCMEGALVAAAVLAYHGHKPLLLDIQSESYDYDHVVALFKQDGLWGAVSKTGHPALRWRDPVYRTVRELAMSYFNEYYWPEKDRNHRRKTMRAYSAPFNLAKFKPETWVTADNGEWLAEVLDKSKHFPTYPKRARKNLRKADLIEIRSLKLSDHGND